MKNFTAGLQNFFLGVNYFNAFWKFILGRLAYLGGLARLTLSFFKQLITRPFLTAELKEQFIQVGLLSLPIAAVTLFFVGVVFAFQFGFTLQTFGAKGFIGRVTTISLLRELSPVFTALIVGGRIGAGMAAEIASMRVTEQIDAIIALGANPIKKLVVPRVIASTIMLPLIGILATLIGTIGAISISWLEFNLSPVSYYGSSMSAVHMSDFLSGICKTFFFGFGVALVGCYEGMHCDLGTKGVGTATTKAIVSVSLLIVITDFFLTRLFAIIL